MNTLKISINKITESLVIFKKIGKCNCMRFFFCRVYICDAISYLSDNIYLKLGSTQHRQMDGIPIGTNFSPLVDSILSWFCSRQVTCKSSDYNATLMRSQAVRPYDK